MMQIITAWKTSDGKLFDNPEDADKHEAQAEFNLWCWQNICVGGEWSAEMVSREILEHWTVVRKSPDSAPGVSTTRPEHPEKNVVSSPSRRLPDDNALDDDIPF